MTYRGERCSPPDPEPMRLLSRSASCAPPRLGVLAQHLDVEVEEFAVIVKRRLDRRSPRHRFAAHQIVKLGRHLTCAAQKIVIGPVLGHVAHELVEPVEGRSNRAAEAIALAVGEGGCRGQRRVHASDRLVEPVDVLVDRHGHIGAERALGSGQGVVHLVLVVLEAGAVELVHALDQPDARRRPVGAGLLRHRFTVFGHKHGEQALGVAGGTLARLTASARPRAALTRHLGEVRAKAIVAEQSVPLFRSIGGRILEARNTAGASCRVARALHRGTTLLRDVRENAVLVLRLPHRGRRGDGEAAEGIELG